MAKDMDKMVIDDAKKIVGYSTIKSEKPVEIEYVKDLYELRLIQTVAQYNGEPTSTIVSRQFSFHQQELEEMAVVINNSALGLKAEVVKAGNYVWTEVR